MIDITTCNKVKNAGYPENLGRLCLEIWHYGAVRTVPSYYAFLHVSMGGKN